MKEYIGQRIVSVSKYEHKNPRGEIVQYTKGGILSIPEEASGTDFWILKTPKGFIMERNDNGGTHKVTRKNPTHVVITVGKIDEVSTTYNCFKIDTGYEFERAEIFFGVGTGEKLISVNQNNRKHKNLFACIPANFIEKLNINRGEYVKITSYFEDDFYVTVEKSEEKGRDVTLKEKRISFVKYVGKSVAFYISQKAAKFFINTRLLAIIEEEHCLRLVRVPSLENDENYVLGRNYIFKTLKESSEDNYIKVPEESVIQMCNICNQIVSYANPAGDKSQDTIIGVSSQTEKVCPLLILKQGKVISENVNEINAHLQTVKKLLDAIVYNKI